ncbi:MAG: hypothetical protein KGH71_01055 [Candidatus Micrarchaeota archaeon]|nr:hypothetical protein [Candidatus Micrarchaeota archaeon]
MQKSTIGSVLIAAGIVLLLYSSYWLYLYNFANPQNELASFCTLSNVPNASMYSFQCSYGLITVSGVSPTHEIPLPQLSTITRMISVEHEVLIGISILLLAAGLLFKYR